MAYAEALWKTLHVRINRQQDCIIGQGRSANHFVCRFFRQYIAMKNDKVTALFENVTNRVRHSRVKENAKSWPVRIRQPRYV